MRPEEYLQKYWLPDDFPLVAKNVRLRKSKQAAGRRVVLPKPQDITSNRADLKRLRAHIKNRDEQDPAVPLDLSVIKGVGFIVLSDGRMVKQLHNFLNKQLSKTVAEYRKEWGLPDCYPPTCNSPFFRRPEEVALLRAAEEKRLEAKAAGKPWPSWREDGSPGGQVSDDQEPPPTGEAAARKRITTLADIKPPPKKRRSRKR